MHDYFLTFLLVDETKFANSIFLNFPRRRVFIFFYFFFMNEIVTMRFYYKSFQKKKKERALKNIFNKLEEHPKIFDSID